MTLETVIVFIGGMIAGIFVPTLIRFVEEVLDERPDVVIGWYGPDHETGVEVRRKVYGREEE